MLCFGRNFIISLAELIVSSTGICCQLLVFRIPATSCVYSSPIGRLTSYIMTYYDMGQHQHDIYNLGGSLHNSPSTDQNSYQLDLNSIQQHNTSPNTQQTIFTVSTALSQLSLCSVVCQYGRLFIRTLLYNVLQ